MPPAATRGNSGKRHEYHDDEWKARDARAGGLILAVGLALACTDTTGTALTYTVGGTVSGLAGSGLVLRDNDGDDLSDNG